MHGLQTTTDIVGKESVCADSTLADDFAAIDRLRSDPSRSDDVAALLAEQSAMFTGRSSNQAARLRGYILAGFETAGLPAGAIGVVCEELESGFDPHVVAAAAKALRGAAEIPAAAPELLAAAIERLRHSDDVVSYRPYRDVAPDTVPTTALGELFRTLRWLGARAAAVAPAVAGMLAQTPSIFSEAVRLEATQALDAIRIAPQAGGSSCCCGPPVAASAPVVTAPDTDIATLELQDQDGAIIGFGAMFSGRPSVLTFFYTRCANPNKCSLTIEKMARLQDLIARTGLRGQVNVAAISYDPAFDLPHRLHDYGVARGVDYDTTNRMLRTTGGFGPLQQWLDLGVGYGATTVNHHRLDLVVLDRAMHCVARIVRRQWDEHEVFEMIGHALGDGGDSPNACTASARHGVAGAPPRTQ